MQTTEIRLFGNAAQYRNGSVFEDGIDLLVFLCDSDTIRLRCGVRKWAPSKDGSPSMAKNIVLDRLIARGVEIVSVEYTNASMLSFDILVKRETISEDLVALEVSNKRFMPL